MEWIYSAAIAWKFLAAGLVLLLALSASGHAVLTKRNDRAAALWVCLVWLMPFLGAVLYFFFGINRLKRRALLRRQERRQAGAVPQLPGVSPAELASLLPENARHLSGLAAGARRFLCRPLLPGNRIEPLIDGDAAYPAMLDAIAAAQHSVTLATYIFDHDETGLAFARALGAAVRRGVQVRVLIDAAGLRYSWPSVLRELHREGVVFARFMPSFPLRGLLSVNLRNHRKLLVIDGRSGFTGGINIRHGHWLAKQPRHPVRDLHFRVEGPVVAHLQEVFADDWYFTTREALVGERWFPGLAPAGAGFARGIADGPDEDFEKLRWTLLAALGAARRSVRIATPYFIPEPTLIASLNLAAMRGVDVRILLPAQSNLPFVQWASTAHWWQVLERGCRLWLGAAPFNHAKLMVVDDTWSLVGSTNWDPRSLRLNFEFNVECYDPALAGRLAAWFDGQTAAAHETSLAEVDARRLPIRLRDGLARLFSPLL